jgi:hypothetical protein
MRDLKSVVNHSQGFSFGHHSSTKRAEEACCQSSKSVSQLLQGLIPGKYIRFPIRSPQVPKAQKEA